jgi:hypothetical protein
MKSESLQSRSAKSVAVAGIVFLLCCLLLGAATKLHAQTAVTNGKAFATPEEAASALIAAAETFDESALKEILGPDSWDIVHTGEPARDKEIATEFAALARVKNQITLQPKNRQRAFLSIGEDEWPFAVPIVKTGKTWSFDTRAGRQELLYRRVGGNELDAIQICRGYVEAQHEYALAKKEGAVNQYAQRIISSEGQQDGLAWKNADGTWGGPLGEKVAAAIARGYSNRSEPYHGYFFKVLKGQGAAAPLGELDYLVKGVMIGGFALIAAPAQYRNTGVKTFIVSQDGVVYEKDLGPKTLELFQTIDRFNPDKTWTPVLDQ